MQESCGLASLRPYREAFKLLLALLLGQVGFQVSRPSGGGEGEDSGSPVSQPLHRGPVWGVLSGCPWRSSSRVGGGGSFPVGAAGPIPNTGFTPRWCSAALSCGQLPRSALLAAEALPHPQAVSGEPRFHKARVVGVILPGACPQPPMHSPRPAASAGISLCHLPRGAPCVSSFALTGAARGLGGRAPAGEGTQVLRALSRWVVGAAVGQGGQVLSTWKALLELDGLPALGHGTQCPAGLPGSELKAPSFCTQQG